MIAAALALMTGFILALGVIFIKTGLQNSNVSSGILVITLIGNILLWPFVFIQNPKSDFSVYGLLVFALAGFFHPGIARLLYFRGMLKVGVSANASIVATSSMFSALFAVLLLNEKTTFTLWLGIVFVGVGAAAIQSSVSYNRTLKRTKWALIIPIVTSVAAGLGYMLKKVGLNVYNEPLVGVATAYLTTLLLYIVLLSVSSRIRSSTRIDLHTFRLFWKTGLCFSIGFLLSFYALQLGSVTNVAPLVQAEPLFIVVLAHFFHRETEPFSKKLALGAGTIVLGVVLITAFAV